MLYLISLGFAVSVIFLLLALVSARPAQARPSRTRLLELGLDGSSEEEAAARRGRARSRLRDVFLFLGTKAARPRVESETDTGLTRQRLTHAGYREPSALTIFLGIRMVAALLLFVYGALIGSALAASSAIPLIFGAVGAGLGWVVPNFVLSRKITVRQKELQKALPDAVDLLVICVEAGLGLNQAFQRVAVEMRHLSMLLTSEIAQMGMETRAGTPRDQALLGLGERTGVADLRSLATMLIQTERFGTSIADSLRIHAETMRTKRQQRAEEAAAKTTIKLVFPLAICIFPALFVVALGPALISMIESFRQLGG